MPSIDAEAATSRLRELADDALREAAGLGATQAVVELSESVGLSVNVRLGDIETLEHEQDRGMGITVYSGKSRGSASTTDFSAAAIRSSVEAAWAIAKHTAADEFSGLPDQDRLATDFPDLDAWHPWDIDADSAIEVARRCEQAARDVDPKITNSEGASVGSRAGVRVLANSLGFTGASVGTSHSLSCSVIAEDNSGMQRDYWYDQNRNAALLAGAEEVGRIAGRRSIARLGTRPLATQRCAVLFPAELARGFFGHFVSAISGGALYRQASFLCDSVGQQVFSADVNLVEQPWLSGAMGSAAFDGEGVATANRELVTNGVVNGYILSSYSARRLGLATTGNAGGIHNLELAPGNESRDSLISNMGTGLLVTELIGHGANTVTGDYSRGAAGFWIENGEIAYPVEEITIAGNLKDMFQQVVAIGNDVDLRGNVRAPSIVVDGLTVAGNG